MALTEGAVPSLTIADLRHANIRRRREGTEEQENTPSPDTASELASSIALTDIPPQTSAIALPTLSFQQRHILTSSYKMNATDPKAEVPSNRLKVHAILEDVFLSIQREIGQGRYPWAATPLRNLLDWHTDGLLALPELYHAVHIICWQSCTLVVLTMGIKRKRYYWNCMIPFMIKAKKKQNDEEEKMKQKTEDTKKKNVKEMKKGYYAALEKKKAVESETSGPSMLKAGKQNSKDARANFDIEHHTGVVHSLNLIKEDGGIQKCFFLQFWPSKNSLTKYATRMKDGSE